MKVSAVSFDCAETLLSVNWAPGEFAVRCAEACQVAVPFGAAEAYERLFSQRLNDYIIASKSGTSDQFWRTLTSDWLNLLGMSASVDALVAAGDQLLYGEPSQVYRVFDDVVPTLRALASQGIPLVVISNWDGTLERVLERFGLRGWFSAVFPSMVVGWEKPDPRIFEAACAFLNLSPSSLLHVGDNPVDDVEGARQAGCQALLLDRQAEPEGLRIASLAEVASRVVD